VEEAIGYLQGALRAAYPLGGGHGPVDHLYRLFPPEEENDPRGGAR
jgi:hydroxymethylpyrimidine/phosphomethylpyrimidine kinase